MMEEVTLTFKSMMKKAGEGTIHTKVSRVLFSYRITPQSTTGRSPAEMLQGRRLRCTLDIGHPDLRAKVERKQYSQKKHHDKHRQERSFQVGDALSRLFYIREQIKLKVEFDSTLIN
uniref:Uncharacterized protein n=1 Tax=Pygocentrus nattereri TaxID=42514 RepID=A0AAR2J520_PYGNA